MPRVFGVWRIIRSSKRGTEYRTEEYGAATKVPDGHTLGQHHLYRVCQPECADVQKCTPAEIKEQCTYSDASLMFDSDGKLLPDVPQNWCARDLHLLGCSELTPNTFSNYCVNSLEFTEAETIEGKTFNFERRAWHLRDSSGPSTGLKECEGHCEEDADCEGDLKMRK